MGCKRSYIGLGAMIGKKREKEEARKQNCNKRKVPQERDEEKKKGLEGEFTREGR